VTTTGEGDGGSHWGGAGLWRVSHAVAAFGAGVVASVAAAAAVWSGGVTVFEGFAVVGATQTLVTIGVVAFLARPPGRQPLGLRPRLPDLGWLLLGAGLVVALSWATYVVIQSVFGGDAPVQSVVQSVGEAEGWAARVAVVVVSVLLAPVSEELVFRGVLLQAVGRRLSVRWAAVVTAAVFALAHFALDFDAATAVPALFVMGWVLAAAVQRSGRLGPAVAAHIGFNLVGVLALFYA
jgi:membrane protease YdiL (CAAX protease family)